jgi:hypothetical protein
MCCLVRYNCLLFNAAAVAGGATEEEKGGARAGSKGVRLQHCTYAFVLAHHVFVCVSCTDPSLL